MRRTGLAVLLAGTLGSLAVAQEGASEPNIHEQIEALQRQIDELRQDRGVGRSSEWAPTRVSSDYAEVRLSGCCRESRSSKASI